MGTEKLSGLNLKSLIILMVLCGSLVNGAFTVRQDTWISVLLMGVLFLPLILIYSRICTIYPEKNLFEIVSELFGRVLGFVFILAMTLYAVAVTALQLRNYTEFTGVISLQNTPPIPIMAVLLVVVIYLAKQGITVLGKWSVIMLTIIGVNIVATIVLSLNIIELPHIFPLMDHSFKDILSNSFTVGSIAVGETVMIMAVMGERKKGSGAFKPYVGGVLFGVGIFALIILRNICILGANLESSAKFSTYMAVRVIDVGNFFERIESSISFVYILMGITKMTLFLTAASKGFAKLIGMTDYKKLLIPTGLLVLGAGTLVYQNSFEMFELTWVYRYMALPFQLLIPLIIWAKAEIMNRGKGAKASALPVKA